MGLKPGPLDTKLCHFMLLSGVFSHFFSNLVHLKEFLDDLRIYLRAKYVKKKLVGLI